jgi:acetyl esterase/lipase
VNYSLIDQSTDHAYPAALHECYDVYRWVIEGRLGLNASSVLLVGDSTGANLAAACCMKAIIDQIRIPDGIILACPILNLRSTPTPSRSLYMMDPVLPMNLLLQLRTLYLTHHVSTQQHTLVDSDPCLSPIVASDELLAQWPTTGIMVGSYDPFVDDSVDFAHRLTENGVKVKLRIFDEAPHSLWDFAPLLPVSQQAVDLTATWMKQILDADEKKKREL